MTFKTQLLCNVVYPLLFCDLCLLLLPLLLLLLLLWLLLLLVCLSLALSLFLLAFFVSINGRSVDQSVVLYTQSTFAQSQCFDTHLNRCVAHWIFGIKRIHSKTIDKQKKTHTERNDISWVYIFTQLHVCYSMETFRSTTRNTQLFFFLFRYQQAINVKNRYFNYFPKKKFNGVHIPYAKSE